MATKNLAIAENPFQFGSVVTGHQFIDRTDKIKSVRDVVGSSNHLVIIAPRRYGKTSLAIYATKDLGRPVINLNLQKIADEADFARQLAKATLNSYPLKKIQYAFSHFSVVPTISTDPITGKVEVALSPSVSSTTALEDAFELLEQAGNKNSKPLVILDEFQAAGDIHPDLLKRLRSIMQMQNNINYILLGSQESMMREIFEKKKSPFYHFGVLMHLPAIPKDEFMKYLSDGFSIIYKDDTGQICRDILDFTDGHPYYTQELAFYAWNELRDVHKAAEGFVKEVIDKAVTRKDYDYERLWTKMTSSGKRCMKALAANPNVSVYTKDFLVTSGFNATSTVRGCINRLLKDGYIINDEKSRQYCIEDPMFGEWIRRIY